MAEQTELDKLAHSLAYEMAQWIVAEGRYCDKAATVCQGRKYRCDEHDPYALIPVAPKTTDPVEGERQTMDKPTVEKRWNDKGEESWCIIQGALIIGLGPGMDGSRSCHQIISRGDDLNGYNNCPDFTLASKPASVPAPKPVADPPQEFEEWWKEHSNGLLPRGSVIEYNARAAWNASQKAPSIDLSRFQVCDQCGYEVGICGHKPDEKAPSINGEMLSALQRLRKNAQNIFDKIPVRDWAETLAEVDAVLSKADSTGDGTPLIHTRCPTCHKLDDCEC